MPSNWTQPEPGLYVGTLSDGSEIVERRTVTESFRQGELLSSDRRFTVDEARDTVARMEAAAAEEARLAALHHAEIAAQAEYEALAERATQARRRKKRAK